ncbi:MAG TPA: hypothetical protein VGQ36_02635 [Thermoanaerobaculia bacterium]|nr:hypothetical protein [Thermoanaerobaculia bacterium]
MLAEFKGLRDETIASLNARIWGTLTYIAAAGGIGAWYARQPDPAALVLLIFTALPLLSYTILRERSRIRIGSYIKVVLEPQLPGLLWETALQRWRLKVPSRSALRREIDKWHHILSLTGVYTLGSAVGVIALVRQPGATSHKVAAGSGILLVVAAHVSLHRIYSAAGEYDAIFKEAMMSEPLVSKESDER